MWYAIETIFFPVVLNYAQMRRIPGQDIRRIIFQKRLDIYLLFGSVFYERKKEEIDNILEKNPFNDNL